MNANKWSWPPSAYVVLVGTVISFAIVIFLVYSQTKDSYRAVGFNDGQIAESEHVMNGLRRSVRVGDCNDYKGQETTRVVTVKALALYIVPAGDGSVRFCEWD